MSIRHNDTSCHLVPRALVFGIWHRVYIVVVNILDFPPTSNCSSFSAWISVQSRTTEQNEKFDAVRSHECTEKSLTQIYNENSVIHILKFPFFLRLCRLGIPTHWVSQVDIVPHLRCRPERHKDRFGEVHNIVLVANVSSVQVLTSPQMTLSLTPEIWFRANLSIFKFCNCCVFSIVCAVKNFSILFPLKFRVLNFLSASKFSILAILFSDRFSSVNCVSLARFSILMMCWKLRSRLVSDVSKSRFSMNLT